MHEVLFLLPKLSYPKGDPKGVPEGDPKGDLIFPRRHFDTNMHTMFLWTKHEQENC